MVSTFPTVNLTKKVIDAPTPTPENRCLIIGQQANGAGIERKLYKNVLSGQEDALFGSNSMITNMIKTFKFKNNVTQLDCIALNDNPAGVEAIATLTVTGTATESGNIEILVGQETVGLSSNLVNVTILTGDDQDTIASAINTAITDAIANGSTMPITSEVLANVVTFTNVHKGTYGNNFVLRTKLSNSEGSIGISGVSIADTAFSGGTGDPTIDNSFFDLIKNIKYYSIVYSDSYPTTPLVSALESRENLSNAVIYSHGIYATTDIYVNLLADASRNDSVTTKLGCISIDEPLHRGNILNVIEENLSSEYSAIRCLKFKEGSNYSAYTLSPDINDQTGGIDLSGLPYANTPLGLKPIEPELTLSTEQVEALNDNGITIPVNNIESSELVMGNVVTGNKNVRYHYLNQKDLADNITTFLFFSIKRDLAQTRFGATPRGYSSFDLIQIRALFVEYTEQLIDLALLPDSEEVREVFNNSFFDSFESNTGTLTFSSEYIPVSQIRKIIGSLLFKFNINTSL